MFLLYAGSVTYSPLPWSGECKITCNCSCVQLSWLLQFTFVWHCWHWPHKASCVQNWLATFGDKIFSIYSQCSTASFPSLVASKVWNIVQDQFVDLQNPACKTACLSPLHAGCHITPILSSIDTAMPNGPLMLRNCFFNFAVEDWCWCCSLWLHVLPMMSYMSYPGPLMHCNLYNIFHPCFRYYLIPNLVSPRDIQQQSFHASLGHCKLLLLMFC